jgi:hypothetical protein
MESYCDSIPMRLLVTLSWSEKALLRDLAPILRHEGIGARGALGNVGVPLKPIMLYALQRGSDVLCKPMKLLDS